MIQSEKKQKRQVEILSRLATLQYATRKQLQTIEQLGGDRNAQRILQDMEREKLITSMKKEQKVYSLAHKGKEFLGITQKELTGRMVEHSLMRNDLYIQLNMPYDWQIEVEAKANGEPFIADAVFTRNGEVHFVEIDHQQTMQKNMEKLDRYKVLAKGLWHQRQQHINVIFYTKTDYRKEKLEEYMQGKGIRGKVYVKK